MAWHGAWTEDYDVAANSRDLLISSSSTGRAWHGARMEDDAAADLTGDSTAMSLSLSCVPCLFPPESTSPLRSESEDAAADGSSSCSNSLDGGFGWPAGSASAAMSPSTLCTLRTESWSSLRNDWSCSCANSPPDTAHVSLKDAEMEEEDDFLQDVVSTPPVQLETSAGADPAAVASTPGREEDGQSETESSLEDTPPPATLDEIAASFVLNEPLEDKRRRARDKHESAVEWMRQGAYGEALALYKEALALYTEVSAMSVCSFWVQYVLIMCFYVSQACISPVYVDYVFVCISSMYLECMNVSQARYTHVYACISNEIHT